MLPDESVTVQVMIVSPSGNDSGASLVTDVTATASLVCASPNDTTLSDNEVASDVMSAGAVMVGAIVSVTVIF